MRRSTRIEEDRFNLRPSIARMTLDLEEDQTNLFAGRSEALQLLVFEIKQDGYVVLFFYTLSLHMLKIRMLFLVSSVNVLMPFIYFCSLLLMLFSLALSSVTPSLNI